MAENALNYEGQIDTKEISNQFVSFSVISGLSASDEKALAEYCREKGYAFTNDGSGNFSVAEKNDKGINVGNDCRQFMMVYKELSVKYHDRYDREPVDSLSSEWDRLSYDERRGISSGLADITNDDIRESGIREKENRENQLREKEISEEENRKHQITLVNEIELARISAIEYNRRLSRTEGNYTRENRNEYEYEAEYREELDRRNQDYYDRDRNY